MLRRIGEPVASGESIGGHGASQSPLWHSRGYLPHFDSAAATQHVTFHLADSLPQTILARLKADMKIFPSKSRDAERRKRLEAWFDAGHGSCALGNPPIAKVVQDSLLFFDAHRYRLFAWVVMPNHVHVLFMPLNGWTVAKIVGSWKKFTGHKIRDSQRASGGARQGPVWHREYWDRYIRSERHFKRAIDYIHHNPVKAGLVARPEDWHWSSASRSMAESRKPATQESGVPRNPVKSTN